jgi:cytochrome P450
MYMVSIQTPSITTFGTVERLIKNPEYVQLLRKEAETIFSNPEDPRTWVKAEIDELHLHDCFIRESMRCGPMLWATMRRSVMKSEGFTFHDGTHVPKDFEIAVPTYQVHHNENRYENPNDFFPERFLKSPGDCGKTEGETLITPSLDFLGFGSGLHAW